MLEQGRHDGDQGDSVGPDDVGILVRAEGGAAVLEDAQAARADLFRDAMIEPDHAVRHVVEEGVARRHVGLVVRLDRQDRGELVLVQPLVERVQLIARARHILEAAHQDIDGVDDQVPRPHGLGLALKDGHQGLQGEGAGGHGGGVDLGLVDEQRPLLLERGQIPAERRRVDADGLRALLEGDQDARLARERVVEQELGGKEGLAGARPALHQRRSPLGVSALENLVETIDPSVELGEWRDLEDRSGWGFLLCAHGRPPDES